MKVKKKINESLLKEDLLKEDEAPSTESADSSDKTDIADAIQDAAPAVSDAKADQIAGEIKKDAGEVGAPEVVISADDFAGPDSKNELYQVLDRAYNSARRQLRRASLGVSGRYTSNVLIEGLPGSGKTAITEAWCNSKGLTLVAVNATDPKLETAINGMPLRDVTKPDANEVAYAYSEKLKPLTDPALKGKCVLFVDEFNRQLSPTLRRPLMSLFNEKRNSDGSLDFSENLLFTVVCINPVGLKFQDKGVAPLTDAEKNRFDLQIANADSNAKDSLAYFNSWIDTALLNLGIIPPNSKASKNHGEFVGPTKKLSEDQLEEAKEDVKIYELAKYILTYPTFRFNNRDDLDDIHDGGYNLFTARSFTNLLNNAGGDIEETRYEIDHGRYHPDIVSMLKDILDSYNLTDEEIYKKYKLIDSADEPEQPVETPVENPTEEEIEDDEDAFSTDWENVDNEDDNQDIIGTMASWN